MLDQGRNEWARGIQVLAGEQLPFVIRHLTFLICHLENRNLMTGNLTQVYLVCDIHVLAGTSYKGQE